MAILADTLTPFQAKPPEQHQSHVQLDDLLNLLTKIELLIYWRLRRWLEAKQRRGETPYVRPARRWIAEQLVPCSIKTVSRAFAHINELGLLVIKPRFRAVPGRRHGRLRRQLTNLIALPIALPRNERDIPVSHTQRQKKKTLHKVGRRPVLDHTSPDQHGFEAVGAILARWKERGEEKQPL